MYTLIMPDKKTIEFATKAEAEKAARYAGGKRIKPSKAHSGLIYYMSPNGELCIRKD